MATLTTNAGIDMRYSQTWYGYVKSYDSRHITITDGWLTGTYYGSFRYDAYGNVYGTMTGYKTTVGGQLVTSLTGGNYDAYTIFSMLDGNSSALNAYLAKDDDRFNLSSGHDYVFAYKGKDVVMSGGGHDTIFGGDGNDSLYGQNGNDYLYGDGSWDQLDGGAGNDNLFGGKGNDTLIGGGGNDTLTGGDGADRILGGAGKDVLYGGAGADVFVFTKTTDAAPGGGRRDTISDFQSGRDNIDLSAIDANARASGDQAFKWIGAKSFAGKAGELSYTNGILRGDTDGDRVADFEIYVANQAALSAADFVL